VGNKVLIRNVSALKAVKSVSWNFM